MSHVCLLAADRPAPLYEAAEQRTRVVRFQGKQMLVQEDGFSVMEHEYYRPAVEELDYPMKPHQYELNLRATEDDLRLLRDYLAKHFAPGEKVELWNLWVGGEKERLARLWGPLDGLDMKELERFEQIHPICLTVEI